MELSSPKLKRFYIFLKKNFLLFYALTPLGETGCLINLVYLLAAQASSFLIHPSFLNTASQVTHQ